MLYTTWTGGAASMEPDEKLARFFGDEFSLSQTKDEARRDLN
jgi:hypothetical protein